MVSGVLVNNNGALIFVLVDLLEKFSELGLLHFCRSFDGPGTG